MATLVNLPRKVFLEYRLAGSRLKERLAVAIILGVKEEVRVGPAT